MIVASPGFSKIFFCVPTFALVLLVQKLSGLNSIESETVMFRLIKKRKVSTAVKSFFLTAEKSFFTQTLHHWVYGLALQRHCINMKIGIRAPHFLFTLDGKIVQDKIFYFERRGLHSFCESHPNTSVTHSCLENVSHFHFWLPANQFPDLVNRSHFQVRFIIGNFGLNGSIPWLQHTGGVICFICKEDIESVTHFFLNCFYFR